MTTRVLKPVYWIAGIASILLGLAGLVLPFLPGWFFIFLGIGLIAPRAAFRCKYRVEQAIFHRKIIVFSEWKSLGVAAFVTTKFFPVLIAHSDDFLKEDIQSEVTRELALKGPVVFLNQVHGNNVAVIDSSFALREGAYARISEADGAVTNVRGLNLFALTADCLSVFFYAPGWVGVAHAGWRGTRLGIVEKTIALLIQKAACSPASIRLILGPSICGKHYRVGEEFGQYFSSPSLYRRGNQYHLDLVQENIRRALGAGILKDHIDASKLCTNCQNTDFYSYRLEKERAGRMISVIRLLN